MAKEDKSSFLQNGPGNLRAFMAVLGKKGLLLIGFGMVSSLILACSEYGLSSLFVAFLSPLIGSSLSKPTFLIIGIRDSLSPKFILGILLLVIAVRSVCKVVSSQSAHILLQLTIQRFRNLQGYELLMTDRGRYLSMSQVNMHFAELIPKAAEFIFLGMNLLIQLLFASAILAWMLAICFRETLLAICLMLVLGLVILRITRLLSAASENIAKQSFRLESIIVRISRNWLFIRLMHTINKEMSAFKHTVQGYYQQGIRMFFYVNVMSVLPQFLGMTSISLFIFFKIYYLKEGGAELLVFFYLFVRFIQAVSFINDQAGKMGNCWHHFQEMLNLTASFTSAEIQVALADSPNNQEKKEFCQIEPKKKNRADCPDLQLKNISFTWPGMKTPLFNNFSVSLSAGSHYGIIGPNGSGKSTLLALILGVLKPDSGLVSLGGIMPGQFLKERRDLGFVSTDPYLFAGTILENITYGYNREIDEAKILSILEMVGLLSTIQQLTGKLNAKLGEGGEGFSSGEKQRLALGRALLREPALLVLDEATANFDHKMEKDMVEILRSLHGRCTVITVTHRAEILEHSDGIIDLGKLPFRRKV